MTSVPPGPHDSTPPTPDGHDPWKPVYSQLVPVPDGQSAPVAPTTQVPQAPTLPYGQPAAGRYGQPAVPTYGTPATPYGQPAQTLSHGSQPGQGYQSQVQHYSTPAPQQQAAWGQPTPPVNKRTGLIVGLVVGGVVVVGATIGGVLLLSNSNSGPLGTVTEQTVAQVQQVGAEHCILDLPADGDIIETTIVPCDETHNAQVVGVKTLPNKEKFPGKAKVLEQTTAMCTPALVTNTDADPGDLQYVAWTPTQESWDQGDRSGLCIAWTSGELTESLLK